MKDCFKNLESIGNTMVSKAVKILVPVAIVVVIGAVFMFAMTASEECRYDYEVELTDSFVGYNGVIDKAGDGKQYAILHITATNESVAGGVNLNPYTWEWNILAKGITYTHCLDHYDHPQHGEHTMDIDMGSTASFVVVFEIPKDLTLGDLDITQKYSRSTVTMIHDDTLIS